jgi:uncharacterized protein YjbI with pentapeptide repeats
VSPLFNRVLQSEDAEERASAVPEGSPETAEAAAGPHITVRAEGSSELIRAEELPSAATALEELFSEDAPTAVAAKSSAGEAMPGGGSTADGEGAVLVAEEAAGEKTEPAMTELPPKRKRRGFFSWLFGRKKDDANSDLAKILAESSAAAHGEPEAQVAVEATAAITDETANSESAEVGETAVVAAEAEAAPVPAETADATRTETTGDLVSAEQLPGAADALAAMFPSESEAAPTTLTADESIETIAETSQDENSIAPMLEEKQIVDEPGESAAEREISTEESNFEGDGNETAVEVAKQASRAAELVEETLFEISRATESADEEVVAANSATPAAAIPTDHAGQIGSDDALIEDELKLPEASFAAEAEAGEAEAEAVLATPYRDWALEDKLASHREWVESHGRAGQRADLSGVELEAADLISVNLRLADLHDTNLRAADMLLADLRDACLVRADLEESCLVGANLEGANLEGATLETAMGLVPRQLAGTNLRDALLAPQLMEFTALAKFARNSTLAYRYFGIMSALSLISWLLIGKTSDAQLLTDSAVLPFIHSRAAAAALPIAEAYLVIPAALFVLYLLFHFHLQQLWDAVQELPAIFPDGHTLGDDEPSIIVGLLRTHFRWMNPDLSSTRLFERVSAMLLAYGIVPVTLLLFWARYLTRQEIHGTLLQLALAIVAFGMSVYALTKVGRPQERWEIERNWNRQLLAKVRAINPITVAAVLGVFLLFVAAGTIAGLPHDRSRAPQFGAANIRRWAPTLFWWIGYDPYADLTEKSLSARPSGWNVTEEQLASVEGARLNNVKLRYAQAYGIFLANAHMLHSNLQGAFMSQADLRGADLGESNLRFTVLDQAHMRGVNLDRSNLNGADLRRTDLRGANLSHSTLQNAVLEDARLDGASLYASQLDGATLNRANFEKADLREAFMAGAHMDHADLQGAYFWSATLTNADLGGAQFNGTILIDADLRGANLGGAHLGGAVLNNTNISGTSLEGADLRGALGLTAAQVCSAKSRRGAVMDDGLQAQVQAMCGAQ